ncbi:MAG: hypothetical protein ACYTEQ_30940, partial [Planctomycetota bacterium]
PSCSFIASVTDFIVWLTFRCIDVHTRLKKLEKRLACLVYHESSGQRPLEVSSPQFRACDGLAPLNRHR